MSGFKARWRVYNFAQANPNGARAGNVPALLRRVARSIASLGSDAVIQDITFDAGHGESPTMTVYYHLDGHAVDSDIAAKAPRRRRNDRVTGPPADR
jgi:hypothetical protein